MLKDFLETFSDELRDPDFAAEYLRVALEEDGMEGFLMALRDVIKANGGMSEVAKSAGLGRESMYKALSAQGNPEFKTVCAVLKALGMHLTVAKNESLASEGATDETAASDSAMLIAA